MRTCFVDANLFIRYLTNDDPDEADREEALLTEAAGGLNRIEPRRLDMDYFTEE